MKSQAKLFITTAVIEVGAGLVLVGLALALWLLFACECLPWRALVVGRLAGAALLALGVSAWFAVEEQGLGSPAALLRGLPAHNPGVVGALAETGNLRMTGAAAVARGAARGDVYLVCGESSGGRVPRGEAV